MKCFLKNVLMKWVDAHFATLDLTNEGSLWDSQISITSLGPCSSWHSLRCVSAVGMSKSTHTRVEHLFITWVKKQTVMCLCGVIGRSDHVDRTRRSVHPELQCLKCDWARPVEIFPLWNLTRVDRTLALSVRSLHLSSSGRTRRNHLGQMN